MTEKRFKLGYVCGDFGLVDNGEWIDLCSMSENSIKNAQICINKMNELAEENEQLKFQNSNLMKEVAEYSRKTKELNNENKQLKDLLKSMADRNNEIWLSNGQIIRLNKVFRGEWTND